MPDAFIAGLPKAELHVHLIGAASPDTVAGLAARYQTSVPEDPRLLSEYFTFRDLSHFTEVYLAVADLVRTADDLWSMTYGVARDLAGQNVRYAEVTLTPYTSVERGIAGEAFCETVEDARLAAARDFGIALRWCFDVPGEFGVIAAESTLALARTCRPDGLVRFGLGGPEEGVPRAQFGPYFRQARAEGLYSTPHAGEVTGAQAVWDAVRCLNADRIGHGIGAAADRELMEYLSGQEIALEICPTSNLCTGAVASPETHPLSVLLASGVRVSVNSDDPAMFSTTLNDEYALAARILNLDYAGVADLARWAVRDAFIDNAFRRELIAQIDEYTRSWS